MSLAVLLDQNVPRHAVQFLQAKRPGWLIRHVSDVGLHGASDDVIFRWAQERSAIVITFDEDFADARMYPVGTHAGIIRLRVWPTTIEQTESALARLLDSTDDRDIAGSLIIRVRRAARHG